MTKGHFTPLSILIAGVATEKPGSHLYSQRSMVVATVLLAKTQTSTLFICSLKLSVDTEKLRFQEAALNTWLLNLEFLF